MERETPSTEELIKNGAIKGREALVWLDQNGEYVYHGSDLKLDELEPRQAHNIDKQTGDNLPDGPPGVAASSGYEIAIFKALINHHRDIQRGLNHHSQFSQNESGPIRFASLKHSIDNALQDETHGYVHVLNKNDFQPFRGQEMRADHPVKPAFTVEVSGKDLPQNIEVLDE